METKHTPGPWTWRNGNTYFDKLGRMMTADLVYAPDHQWVAAVWQDVGVITQEANARLIAAAPDLLTALEGCLESLNVAIERSEGDTFGVHHNQAQDNIDAAERAIAKAKGV